MGWWVEGTAREPSTHTALSEDHHGKFRASGGLANVIVIAE